MARRSFAGNRPALRQGQRRQTEWFASADQTGIVVLGGNTFLFSQSLTAAELAKRPFTVTRVVGSVWVASDQVAAAEQPFGALGFLVVSDKAVALGATALPDPITQEGSDSWFVYRSFAGSGGPIEGRPMIEHMFDSKAQRRVEDGEDIAVMLSNANAAQACAFILKFRMLVKLS